jgi:hypothetical protein
MPRARVVHRALGVLLLAACGGKDGSGTGDVDAGPCWPLNATPGGEVELGTGDIDFEPLADTLQIVSSPAQSDPYVQIHARIRDLPPGDPNDIFASGNPKTKVDLVIESLGLSLGVACPASLGYGPAPESGAFDMVHSLHVGFGFMPIDNVPGTQGRVTIEVVGSNGHYAKAEKLVTLTAAPSP